MSSLPHYPAPPPPPAADPSALAVCARYAALVDADGETRTLSLGEAALLARQAPPLVCHARVAARRLGCETFPAYDLLELFAFVHPARFCAPTPQGLARALELPVPHGAESEALTLHRAAWKLLADVAAPGRKEMSDPVAIAWEMGRGGWLWTGPVLHALGKPQGPEPAAARHALKVWNKLPEWRDEPPDPPPPSRTVSPNEARNRLQEFLAAETPGKSAEPRPQQADYASAVTAAFAPRPAPNAPAMVLAEAGTGVGKTLGYLAPATVWAEKNGAAVWVSTYTRNLQHQIDNEMVRLYPDPAERARRVVLRKGRENYLCLLNLDEATRMVPTAPHLAAAVGLMARWTAATRDGDLSGGDFPGWLADLAGRGRTLGLADRRGECIYSACDHYARCFIERSVRRARKADVVIANHALVLAQAAMGGGEDMGLPSRYVFDEGHHLFDAADSAFSAHLTGREGQELRRWLLGAEEGGRSRARGLKRRVEDIVADDQRGLDLMTEISQHARALPGEGWPARLADDNPHGATEKFLCRARVHVLARAHGVDGPYSLEADAADPVDGLKEAAAELAEALTRLLDPLKGLRDRLLARLDDEATELDGDQRRRIDAAAGAIERRGVNTLTAWRSMLGALGGPTPPAFVDWFAIDRIEGREADVGFHRHWIDASEPLALALGTTAHGVLVTSATLTDRADDDPLEGWRAAEARTGAVHLPLPAVRAQVPSPFDYPNRTRVLLVNDVRKDDLNQVAAAYRELFRAAGGGALGLFTAIGRLREVHRRIAPALDADGLALYAQHVDPMDVGTLVDIFRGDEHACLLGTDAVRDGVDVPGRSLRLIVFDRAPWPRPDILHRARREYFGRRRYEDMLTRLRLKQAFGRLVRRSDDCGVFVLLDPMTPSRLLTAFPEGVEVRRVGLAEAAAATRGFLNPPENG